MTALLLNAPVLSADAYDLQALSDLVEAPAAPHLPNLPLHRTLPADPRVPRVGARLLTFTVHARHVAAGRRRAPRDCPVAGALYDLLVPAHPAINITVSASKVTFNLGDRSVTYQPDGALRQAILLLDRYGYFWGQDIVQHRLYHPDHLPPPFVLDVIPLDMHHYANRLAMEEAIGVQARPPRLPTVMGYSVSSPVSLGPFTGYGIFGSP